MTTELLEAPGDAQRRQGLRRMRIVATSLLIFAALVYLLTLGRTPASVLGFVNTAAEAAMVGHWPTGSRSPHCSGIRWASRSRTPRWSNAARTSWAEACNSSWPRIS